MVQEEKSSAGRGISLYKSKIVPDTAAEESAITSTDVYSDWIPQFYLTLNLDTSRK